MSEMDDAPFVKLVVEDDGPGIPLEHRKHVFDRFYRVAGGGEDGCGLGLSIVREIALRHDTRIRLDEPDDHSGAIFSVRFRLVND